MEDIWFYICVGFYPFWTSSLTSFFFLFNILLTYLHYVYTEGQASTSTCLRNEPEWSSWPHEKVMCVLFHLLCSVCSEWVPSVNCHYSLLAASNSQRLLLLLFVWKMVNFAANFFYITLSIYVNQFLILISIHCFSSFGNSIYVYIYQSLSLSPYLFIRHSLPLIVLFSSSVEILLFFLVFYIPLRNLEFSTRLTTLNWAKVRMNNFYE